MLLDFENERLVMFSKPQLYWPVEPKPHIAQLHRWRVKGLLNPRMVRVQLETIMLGGRRYTSHEAVARFIAALNDEQPKFSTARAKEALRALDAIMDSRRRKPKAVPRDAANAP